MGRLVGKYLVKSSPSHLVADSNSEMLKTLETDLPIQLNGCNKTSLDNLLLVLNTRMLNQTAP